VHEIAVLFAIAEDHPISRIGGVLAQPRFLKKNGRGGRFAAESAAH